MHQFSRLFERLDTTTSTNKKVEALQEYFSHAPAQDAAWAIYFMSGRRIKRLVPRASLKRWLVEVSNFEEWIVDECYNAVGDLAETISLLARADDAGRDCRVKDLQDLSLAHWVEERILPLRTMSEEEQGAVVKQWWLCLPSNICFVVTKLLTGALRVGVSQLLVAKALERHTQIERPILLHRMMGDWQVSADFYLRLIDPDTQSDDISQPYPFYLASPLDKAPSELGEVSLWQAEWKWDGIRAQVIKREGQVFIWSRGEELVSDKFPEIATGAKTLPDGTVLDGEIVAWRDNQVQNFNELQRRIGRKNVSKKMLSEVPVYFLAYDLLEHDKVDVRGRELAQRRQLLAPAIKALNAEYFGLSLSHTAQTWQELEQLREHSRSHRVEGLMLKKLDSPYETGRKKGAWWKWKVDPLTIDAVLLYAQAGHGRRASLFTDYTFAVWRGEELLPVAKAYSGLDNKEIEKLDKWIRANTLERFGPVRSVKIAHVFEIGFEGIAPSTRHKSGIALRFPRILRWRHDMKPKDANNISMVEDLLKVYAGG